MLTESERREELIEKVSASCGGLVRMCGKYYGRARTLLSVINYVEGPQAEAQTP